MYRASLTIWCCWLLIIVSSSSQENSTNDSKQNNNSTMEYKLDTNSNRDRWNEIELIRYNLGINSTTDDNQVWYEFRVNSTKNHKEEEVNQVPIEFSANYTMYESKDNSTLYKFHEYYNIDNDENNTVMYETCNSSICINLCCPLGHRLTEEDCVLDEGNYSFPEVNGSRLNEVFQLVIQNPCSEGSEYYALDNNSSDNSEFKFLADGSLEKPYFNGYVPSTDYCLAVIYRDKYDLSICNEEETTAIDQIIFISLMVSLLFLLITFVVYSILPELQNMHGYTMRAYIASLFVMYATYLVFYFIKMDNTDTIGYSFCILFSFGNDISSLASYLWLNVICIDIWWTFGNFRSLQGRIQRKKDKRKFVKYSLCVWGSISIWITICAIMNFIPNVPEGFIRPEYCINSDWLSTEKAVTLYYYVPVGISVGCNIVLFISTMIRIIRHKKNMANYVGNSKSKSHGDSEHRICIYLKLFIVMGMSWVMDITAWIFRYSDPFNIIQYLNLIINSLQGFIIFVAFVWRRKIKQQLVKRFDWQNRNLLCRNSTNNTCKSTSTATCTITLELTPMQVGSCVQANCSVKDLSNDTIL